MLDGPSMIDNSDWAYFPYIFNYNSSYGLGLKCGVIEWRLRLAKIWRHQKLEIEILNIQGLEIESHWRLNSWGKNMKNFFSPDHFSLNFYYIKLIIIFIIYINLY